MQQVCPNCAQENPEPANFCAACGQELGRSASGPIAEFVSGSNRRSRGGGGFIVVLLLLVVGVAAAYSVPTVRRSVRNVWTRCVSSNCLPEIKTIIKLPPEKAEAMFSLLAPADIAVKVGRRRDGVLVIGTETEVMALKRFGQILTRYHGLGRGKMEACMRRDGLCREPTERFDLPKDKRSALFHILAYDDVPILVAGGRGEIHITATDEDARVVHNVVEILRGRRLCKTKPEPEYTSQHNHKHRIVKP